MTKSSTLRHSLRTLLAASLAMGMAAGCGNSHPKATNAGGGGKNGSGGKNGGGGDNGGGAGGDNGGDGGGNGNGGSGNGNGGSGNGGNGNGGNGNGGSGNGGSGAGGMAPPAACMGAPMDAPADPITITNNQIASPSPPGNLKPADAPQILVFGWDDVENAPGIQFVNSLLGGITNPDGKKAGATLNPNACYAYPAAYQCGDSSLSQVKDQVTVNKFDMGNHTIDHLESNSTWNGLSAIPAKYKDPMTGSWLFTPDGFGPGIMMDQATWESILAVNATELKNAYGVGAINGFRAPRLELNDQGLNALKKLNYYDEDLEETMPDGHVDAATMVDTAAKKGFNWIPWPYTLDHGSPGIWQQQWDGDKKWVVNYPQGVWELPVYMLHVPAKGGLGKTIADTMLAADKDCEFPPGTPADQKKHCYLGEGELAPGDIVKEITGFDFNTFIYGRLTKDQFLTIMKHSFLIRFYGNRAPLTYGAHPIEYTAPYDDFTLGMQGNNYGYRNVLKYSTYMDRQAAMREFVQWITSDPVLSKETYFLSGAQLVEYMKHPFNKAGMPVMPDTVATPDSNGVFTRLKWTTDHATITPMDGNSADIVFDVGTADGPPSFVTAGISPGAFKNVSHIDIKYTTDVPFRVRLLTSDGETVSTTALLAGVGTTDRVARIRVKDFFVGPESPANVVGAAGLVDAAYMAKVTGIGFESAQTATTGGMKKFTAHIKQLTVHGVATAALCQ
jgi:hypothetical protein